MTQLHHELLTAEGAAPARWLLLTHGILGAGGNWRRIARGLVQRQPMRGVVLVDLRGHGRSPQGEPPHTLAACAADVAALIAALRADGRAVDALAGHSFGGKVVLQARALPDVAALQTWLLDSSPSARPPGELAGDDGAIGVLGALEALPPTHADRAAFVVALEAVGHSSALAHWLALSLVPDEGGVRLRFDLPAVRAMITDYLARDLWPLVTDDALPGEVHLVVAERSTTVSAADRTRLAAAEARHRVHGHLVAGAGHWLHVDAPDAVIELLATRLP